MTENWQAAGTVQKGQYGWFQQPVLWIAGAQGLRCRTAIVRPRTRDAQAGRSELLQLNYSRNHLDPEWPHEPVTAEKCTELIGWMAAGLARSYRHFAHQRREGTQSAGRPYESPHRQHRRSVATSPAPVAAERNSSAVAATHRRRHTDSHLNSRFRR